MVDPVRHFIEHHADVVKFLHREIGHSSVQVILAKGTDLLRHLLQGPDRPIAHRQHNGGNQQQHQDQNEYKGKQHRLQNGVYIPPCHGYRRSQGKAGGICAAQEPFSVDPVLPQVIVGHLQQAHPAFRIACPGKDAAVGGQDPGAAAVLGGIRKDRRNGIQPDGNDAGPHLLHPFVKEGKAKIDLIRIRVAPEMAAGFPVALLQELIGPVDLLHVGQGGGIKVLADIVALVIEQIHTHRKGGILADHISVREQIHAVGQLGLHLLRIEMVPLEKALHDGIVPDGYGTVLKELHLGIELGIGIFQIVLDILPGLPGEKYRKHQDQGDSQKQDRRGRGDPRQGADLGTELDFSILSHGARSHRPSKETGRSLRPWYFPAAARP